MGTGSFVSLSVPRKSATYIIHAALTAFQMLHCHYGLSMRILLRCAGTIKVNCAGYKMSTTTIEQTLSPTETTSSGVVKQSGGVPGVVKQPSGVPGVVQQPSGVPGVGVLKHGSSLATSSIPRPMLTFISNAAATGGGGDVSTGLSSSSGLARLREPLLQHQVAEGLHDKAATAVATNEKHGHAVGGTFIVNFDEWHQKYPKLGRKPVVKLRDVMRRILYTPIN